MDHTTTMAQAQAVLFYPIYSENQKKREINTIQDQWSVDPMLAVICIKYFVFLTSKLICGSPPDVVELCLYEKTLRHLMGALAYIKFGPNPGFSGL
jgi:hypothetical protein